MRNAIRHLGQVYSGASEANIFEPPRGPANVTHLPLNPIPLTFLAASAAEAGVHDLKAAMMLAGLFGGRQWFFGLKPFFFFAPPSLFVRPGPLWSPPVAPVPRCRLCVKN